MAANEISFPLAGKARFKARALFIAERIDLKAMESTSRLASFPLVFSVRGSGCAVLFRFGVVVLFNVDPMDEVSYIEGLKPFLAGRFDAYEKEEAEVHVDSSLEESVLNDVICVKESSVEVVQVVAEVISRSAVLNFYESKVAKSFDSIEPLAESLRRKGNVGPSVKLMLERIGDILLSEHTMVGRVEVSEKPELLWERPAYERLFARLMVEYEIEDRHRAIERKLNLISKTTETVLDLIRTKQSHRLEWYIIGLIIFEIIISLYHEFLR